MAVLNFPYDQATTIPDFITQDFMNGYKNYQQNYVEYMNRDTSIASDGTPLSNHFLVMTFNNLEKIRTACMAMDETILPYLDELLQNIADKNFPDKNPNNHNILYVHEEKLGCAVAFLGL